VLRREFRPALKAQKPSAKQPRKSYNLNVPGTKTVKFKVAIPKVKSVASSQQIKQAVQTVKGNASREKKK
jgi:hypothetical protein